MRPCCRLKNRSQHAGGFETIGTPEEQAPLVLAELQSYDEMALSALLGMSVPTHFINEGGRRNCGGVGQTEYVKSGVYVGLVGARFERPGLMEWQHLIVEPNQNTVERGYGPPPAGYVAGNSVRRDLLQAWARIYGEQYFPLYEHAKETSRARPGTFIELSGGRPGALLNVNLYKRRMRMVSPALFAIGRFVSLGAVGYDGCCWLARAVTCGAHSSTATCMLDVRYMRAALACRLACGAHLLNAPADPYCQPLLPRTPFTRRSSSRSSSTPTSAPKRRTSGRTSTPSALGSACGWCTTNRYAVETRHTRPGTPGPARAMRSARLREHTVRSSTT